MTIRYSTLSVSASRLLLPRQVRVQRLSRPTWSLSKRTLWLLHRDCRGYGFGGDADISAKLEDKGTGTAGDLIPEDGRLTSRVAWLAASSGATIALGMVWSWAWRAISRGRASMGMRILIIRSVTRTIVSIPPLTGWGTARAKIGFELGDAVIYGTGGLAFAGIDVDLDDASGHIDSDHGTQFGWTLGAGVSYLATEHLMLGVEYLYVDLGDDKYDFGSSGHSDVDINMHIIRGSVGFKF